ncbi:MAG: Spo0E family sporulation regulatory protein-aspartic acid phosphatase [Clostridiaceae bacterium]|nr:Spo0E family sporulation regulatory protein-aspartic acid phosphatase [Clostridiaceae bacterium]
MKEINKARRNLYRVLESGKYEEIIKASRKLDKLILVKMKQLKNKKQCLNI